MKELEKQQRDETDEDIWSGKTKKKRQKLGERSKQKHFEESHSLWSS